MGISSQNEKTEREESVKSRIVLIIFIILFSFTSANSAGLVDTKKIVDDIAKSINEQPEQWIDTGYRFVFCEDPSKMKDLKQRVWPENYGDVALTYNFYATFFYAKLEKPFEYAFEGKKLEHLIQAIKLYKLKRLKKEVGHLLWLEEKKAEKNLEPKKEQIVNEGRLKKL